MIAVSGLAVSTALATMLPRTLSANVKPEVFPSKSGPTVAQVLLLDEITVDLDVLGRADLLAYLRAETEERGACIVYATHIFDGLESWATHLMYLANGGLKVRGADGARVPGAHQGLG